ncbi:hypothetical protein [Methylobacterium bullatum]|uniref:Uncharacterized protein n=1 Tax=Methylobacterium bullatum TaxID=570505 RepID=A0AAV4ZB86_9HYPH|nr:hypothetical protein [Methylobacterium bullatum]MBD8902765.1 hypothetical protein [Methylobacterium bullatum]GJD41328.1 hypothetical protein OICFNHDK_3811 [Methylobacterium bullatum]
MSETIAEQIVRLLDAIANKYDGLRYVEPLVEQASHRYGELKSQGRDFGTSSRIARSEAVAALINRGGHLPPAPEFDDAGEVAPPSA